MCLAYRVYGSHACEEGLDVYLGTLVGIIDLGVLGPERWGHVVASAASGFDQRLEPRGNLRFGGIFRLRGYKRGRSGMICFRQLAAMCCGSPGDRLLAAYARTAWYIFQVLGALCEEENWRGRHLIKCLDGVISRFLLPRTVGDVVVVLSMQSWALGIQR